MHTTKVIGLTPDTLSYFSSHITATLRTATELAGLVDILFLYKDTTNKVDRPNINKNTAWNLSTTEKLACW